MSNDVRQGHNAVAHAGWDVARRLACLLIEKGIVSQADVVEMYRVGVESHAGGDPNRQAAAALFETRKTSHEIGKCSLILSGRAASWRCQISESKSKGAEKVLMR